MIMSVYTAIAEHGLGQCPPATKQTGYTIMLPTISYGDIKVDFNTVPAASLEAVLRRGVAHFLGNEQASKVASHFADQPDATAEAKATFKAECIANALKALSDGTVGASNRGPRGSTIDTVIRGLAEKEVKAILKANGLTMPSGDKVIEFANGDKLTRAQLIDRRIAKEGERLKAEATKEMARTEKAAKAVGVDALL